MQTAQTKNSVLDKDSISRKIRRMAFQVAEQNIDENQIIVAGISGNGEIVAKCLVTQLNNISSLKTTLTSIRLNKKDPLQASLDQKVDFENKVIVIVDDVADTGRTMLYAIKPFLDFHPKKIQTLVLVERSHKLFPVQTDYTGLSITTTLQEHITVETNGEDLSGAWLY
jgi:pyrimidine operon attenuation protein/uracil phosphoribosyltransferase